MRDNVDVYDSIFLDGVVLFFDRAFCSCFWRWELLLVHRETWEEEANFEPSKKVAGGVGRLRDIPGNSLKKVGRRSLNFYLLKMIFNFLHLKNE